jgi:preprotein translocase subunit SecG
MQKFSRRTTVVLTAAFLVVGMGMCFALQATGSAGNVPRHCSCHSGIITCAPAGNS